MKLLAIETSTDYCSVALLVDNEVLDQSVLAPRQHTALILPMIRTLLDEAGIILRELDALAFGCGPGGFTGVRLATAVIQGVAFAADLPVVPVSTLAAMSYGIFGDTGQRRVVAALDARMQEVYWGAYEINAENYPFLVVKECVISPTQVPLPPGNNWYGVGSGFAAYELPLRGRLGLALANVDAARYPHAREIVRLGAYKWQRGQVVSAEAAQPVYLRDEVASKKA